MNGQARTTAQPLHLSERTDIADVSSGLRSLTDKPIGHVIVIGAGDAEALPEWIDLGAQSVVLVEGDADRADALRARVSRRPDVRVVAEVVSPDGMPVDWHSYTFPALDGPMGIEGIAIRLPRVRTREVKPRLSIALHRLIDDVVSGGPEDRCHVLVLNVAGQEAALLQSLPRECLAKFDVVVVRGCRVSRDGNAPNCRDTVQSLAQGFFALHSFDAESAPLWPTAVLRIDRARLAVLELRERLDEAVRSLVEAEAARDEAAQRMEERVSAASAEQRDAIVKLKAASDAQQASLDATTQELDRARTEADSSRRHSASLEQALGQAIARADASEAARRELEGQAQARDSEIAALRAALDDLRASARELGDALTERERERDATLQRASLAEMNLEAMTVQASEALRSHGDLALQLGSARERLAVVEQLVGDGIRQVAQRSVDLVTLRRERDDSIERERLLREECDMVRRSLEQASSDAEGLAKRIATLEEVISAANLERDVARAEAARERQTSHLAVRLATLRENDLVELRERYAILDKRDRERDQLLESLAQTLTVMAARLGLDVDSNGTFRPIDPVVPDVSKASADDAAQTRSRTAARRRGASRSSIRAKA